MQHRSHHHRKVVPVWSRFSEHRVPQQLRRTQQTANGSFNWKRTLPLIHVDGFSFHVYFSARGVDRVSVRQNVTSRKKCRCKQQTEKSFRGCGKIIDWICLLSCFISSTRRLFGFHFCSRKRKSIRWIMMLLSSRLLRLCARRQNGFLVSSSPSTCCLVYFYISGARTCVKCARSLQS